MRVAQRNHLVGAAGRIVLAILEVHIVLDTARNVECTIAPRLGAVDTRTLGALAVRAVLLEALPIHLEVVDRLAALAVPEEYLWNPERARQVRPAAVSEEQPGDGDKIRAERFVRRVQSSEYKKQKSRIKRMMLRQTVRGNNRMS